MDQKRAQPCHHLKLDEFFSALERSQQAHKFFCAQTYIVSEMTIFWGLPNCRHSSQVNLFPHYFWETKWGPPFGLICCKASSESMQTPFDVKLAIVIFQMCRRSNLKDGTICHSKSLWWGSQRRWPSDFILQTCNFHVPWRTTASFMLKLFTNLTHFSSTYRLNSFANRKKKLWFRKKRIRHSPFWPHANSQG